MSQYCRVTLPDRMRAVLMTGIGGFEMLSVRDDVAVPRPIAGEVLIRVGAAGVNNTDINTRTGWYAKDVLEPTMPMATVVSERADIGWGGNVPRFPRIQGADVCGTIVAVGPGVSTERVGQRVIVEPVFRALGAPLESAIYFGSEVDGAFAEFASVPSIHAHRIECRLSDEALASFPCSYSAAENMVHRAAVGVDEVVLVTGASGGVGSAAVQLARRRGAEVIAIAGADKRDALRALGVTDVIDRGAQLGAALAGRRIDVVIDVVGGPQWPSLLDVLRPGGRYAVAGAIAGPMVSLDLRVLYLKDLRLIGCTVLDHEVFPNLVGYVERGEIQPLVSAMYPLAEIVAAQQAFLTKQHVGKIVLRCR